MADPTTLNARRFSARTIKTTHAENPIAKRHAEIGGIVTWA
ncbi:hypothetical protein [Neptunicoccus cionae]|nr:hypothetical protein [Amylibacter cionae]